MYVENTAGFFKANTDLHKYFKTSDGQILEVKLSLARVIFPKISWYIRIIKSKLYIYSSLVTLNCACDKFHRRSFALQDFQVCT